MSIAGLTTQVSSDFLLFDPYRRCLACDRPAQHWERATQHHPVLAGGVCIDGGGFRQLAVLCSACVAPGSLEQVLWEARRLAERPSDVCFVYQLVGPLSVRVKVKRFVDSLRQYPPAESDITLSEAQLDELPGE
jgi:hypothetical protein